MFFTRLKIQKFKQACPTNLDFLGGTGSKTKVGACVETTPKSSNVNYQSIETKVRVREFYFILFGFYLNFNKGNKDFFFVFLFDFFFTK